MDIRYVETYTRTGINAYIAIDVVIDAEVYSAAVEVGAPESMAGTIEAAGCGVTRRMCSARWVDTSDWAGLPPDRRDDVLSACMRESWRLWVSSIADDDDGDDGQQVDSDRERWCAD
jgi:hypothetical protein